MALIEASSQAKVQRYVPSFFGPACPPRGVMKLREAVRTTVFHNYDVACFSRPLPSHNQVWNSNPIADIIISP